MFDFCFRVLLFGVWFVYVCGFGWFYVVCVFPPLFV